MTQKEQARLQVLNGILEGQISVDEAAEVLGVSERHVWRILAEYRKEGAAALAHGNRGRRANNSIPEEARTQVVALARTRYARVNHTHLTELLAEREEIVLGRSTVRRILVGAGMASPRRRRPPLHRVRRQRMSQEGMLVQVDGSVHAWLEERGPRCTLLLAIDDATSTVPYALFRHEEDTHGYFLLMQELIRRCGVPLALYSDRHAVFKYVPGSHQSPAPTQFGRAMAELGVEQIFARSPEAKGRVERANGTFQDRLVTELRLAGARTISEANQVLWAFLTRFNKRFGVPPAQSTNAYRSPDPDLNLAGILCFKHSRKVARDNTVKYNWHTLQLLPSSERSTYVGAHVVVQERLDGKLVVCYQNQIVPTQEAPPRPGVLRTLNATRGLGSVAKEGARHHGYTGKRGYHPLLAIAAGTGDVLMSRLREGRANTARGAAHFLRETVGRVRYAGANGRLTLRADSGFYTHGVVSVCRKMDVRFSITIRQHKSLHNLIEAIPEDAWTPIPYWMDGAADVAETTCTPFQAEADAAPVRLIVRRVKPTPGSQLALFAKYSYHGFITDRDGELLELEADHRRHAEIENAIRDLKYGVGLNHLPSGRFAANGAWLAVQTMAHNLARWTARIGLGQQTVTTKTLRRRVFALAGRITRSARRLTLHLPRRWPWEEQFSRALARLRAIPLPA